jgi:hypothetical protein
MFVPTKEQVKGALRIFVPSLVIYAAAKGYISVGADQEAYTSDLIDSLAGGIVAAAVIWSIWANSRTGLIKSTSELKEVKQVVTEKHIADEGPLKDNPKVVSKKTA